MIEKGAAINDQDMLGKYVFSLAHVVVHFYSTCLLFCISNIHLHFYIFNSYFSTPLHLDAGEGFLEVVKALVDAGADTEMMNESGQTAYDVAMENDRVEVVEYLSNL